MDLLGTSSSYLQVFTVGCLTTLTCFPCCSPLSSSSRVLFILVPCSAGGRLTGVELRLVWHASLYSLIADCLGDSVFNSTLTVVVGRDLCMLLPDNGCLFGISDFQHSAAYGFSTFCHIIFPIVSIST
jgi:hypothetical protein